MCKDEKCPSRKQCVRFMAAPSAKQSYANFGRGAADRCKNFVEIRPRPGRHVCGSVEQVDVAEWHCPRCEAYYSDDDLTDEEKTLERKEAAAEASCGDSIGEAKCGG